MTDPDSWDAVDDFKTCAALDGFDAAEREQLINEANEILGQRAYERRLVTARYYLTTWPIEMWPNLISHFPELEDELNRGARLCVSAGTKG